MMKWSDITLNQFLQLQDLLKIEDETEKLISISELIFGSEITNLKLADYSNKIKELSFLKEEIPTNHIVKSVTINGRKYNVDGLLGNINTAQYLDFTNYAKTNDIVKMLSVFFIPVEHKYNDGYNMQQVINDMGDLPIDIANSTAFFFNRQLEKFIQIFQYYSVKQIKKQKLPKEQKKKLINLINSAYYPTY